MKLIEYTDIDEYLSQVQEYLMKNEARSNLALGIALQIKKDPLRYPQHFLAAVFDLNDQPILVALMTMPYPLIVQESNLIQTRLTLMDSPPTTLPLSVNGHMNSVIFFTNTRLKQACIQSLLYHCETTNSNRSIPATAERKISPGFSK